MSKKKIEVEIEYEPGDVVGISVGRKIVCRKIESVLITVRGLVEVLYKLDDGNVVNTDEIYPEEEWEANIPSPATK